LSLILNIETATVVCSVALSKDETVISLKESNETRTHAESITLFIQQSLEEAGRKMEELDAIAVSKGPGSYTGLRIGVSTAKGLCYALNKPLIGINTLQALALKVSSDERTFHKQISDKGFSLDQVYFCPMIDARRMEVYTALYDIRNQVKLAVTASIIDRDFYSDVLKTNMVLFFGDGAAKCKEILSHQTNALFIDDVFPSAGSMTKLSHKEFENKNFEDVAYFEPYYLKDFMITAPKKK
jgi:tRNA threonylcarbamoyladenosine biosynthesis protein TsaB